MIIKLIYKIKNRTGSSQRVNRKKVNYIFTTKTYKIPGVYFCKVYSFLFTFILKFEIRNRNAGAQPQNLCRPGGGNTSSSGGGMLKIDPEDSTVKMK